MGEETKDEHPTDSGAEATPPDEELALTGEHTPLVDPESADPDEPGDDGHEALKTLPPTPGDPPWHDDVEQTVNLTGDFFPLPGRDDLDEPTKTNLTDDLESSLRAREAGTVARTHLKGLLEALIFASDSPIKAHELAKTAAAPGEDVKHLLGQLKEEYAARGMQLSEVAGGWSFRTNATYAPFVRDLTKQKPVKLSRAQIETLAILAYRQPITRPEIDEIRGVDSGATLKMLLERDVVKILGKKDEPGRPLLYGTTSAFLELFQLKSLKDLPTLREFTELNEDSRRVVERELGETLEEAQGGVSVAPPPGMPSAPPPDPREFEEDGIPEPLSEADASRPTQDQIEVPELVEDVEPSPHEERGATGEAEASDEPAEDEDDEPDSDDFDDDDDEDDEEDEEEDEEDEKE